MGKILIVAGIILILVGLLIQVKFPFGKLPGDISYHRGNFHFYFPLTTSIILSILLTLLLMFFTRK
ncbi:MAG: DUF2905 domain-containing protein [Candidatus Omnitrophica bacterium]|nr:DUF2905 domain-containing protein [Candidatus Omnitrophota bacterium]MCM8817765.1 DUF2905 domain-containing protein [Candidatus Omnitrophota bacterium]